MQLTILLVQVAPCNYYQAIDRLRFFYFAQDFVDCSGKTNSVRTFYCQVPDPDSVIKSLEWLRKNLEDETFLVTKADS